MKPATLQTIWKRCAFAELLTLTRTSISVPSKCLHCSCDDFLDQWFLTFQSPFSKEKFILEPPKLYPRIQPVARTKAEYVS